MLILTYQWKYPVDSMSGPGWTWDEIRKIYSDDKQDDLREKIEEMHRQMAEDLLSWEAYDPKYRVKKHIPPFQHIRIRQITDWDGEAELMAHGQQTFNESLGATRAAAVKKRAADAVQKEEAEKATLARLLAKYPS